MNNVLNKILFNTGAQLLGRSIGIALGLISITLLTRYLGTEGYGKYSLVFSYLAFFGLIADMGIGLLIVRDFSKDKADINELISNYFLLKVVLISIAVLISLLLLLLTPYDMELKTGILIAIVAMAFGSISGFGTSIFQAKLRMDLVAFIDNLVKFITVSLIILFVYLRFNLLAIISTVLIGNLIGVFITYYLFTRFILRNKTQTSFSLKKLNISKDILKQSLLMGVLTVMGYFYFKIDVLVLSFYRPSSDLGIYSLSYRIIENLLIIWGFVTASVFPVLSKFSDDYQKQKKILVNSILIAIFTASICVCCLLLFNSSIIQIFGGDNFMESVTPLRILSFSIPFFFVNNVIYYYFHASKQIGLLIITLSGAFLINFLLNVIYIPKFGYIAASYVTLITEIYILISYIVISLTKKVTNIYATH